MDNNRIDILNRAKFVDDVFYVIETLSKNRKSSTFAINGEWGIGKSFVLGMLEEKLSSWQNEETADDKYIVFHYNCWQYDYYDEPLVAIVSALYDEAEKQCHLFSSKTSKMFKDVWLATKSSVGFIAGGVTQRLFGVNAHDMFREAKKGIEESHDSKGYDEFVSFQSVILDAREKISKIAENYTIIVVVDELDRCLPEYAIKVLERLHHLFDNIDNLIVLLAVDKEHLNNTVSQIFGFNSTNSKKDINSYLAKFIDFELNLDNGTVNENYKNKYPEYYSKFIANNNTISNFDEIVSSLLDPFEPRKRDKIFEKAELIHKMVFDEKVDISIMLVELLFVSYSFIQDSIEFGSEASFFFKKAKELFPRFYIAFERDIIRKSNYSIITNPVYDRVVGYKAKCTNNTPSQLLYYISCHNKFKTSFQIDDDHDEVIQKNGERMKSFFELIDIIK